MTKKTFASVAAKIKSINYTFRGTPWDDGYNVGVMSVIRILADEFEAQNPRFDRARFIEACGLSESNI